MTRSKIGEGDRGLLPYLLSDSFFNSLSSESVISCSAGLLCFCVLKIVKWTCNPKASLTSSVARSSWLEPYEIYTRPFHWTRLMTSLDCKWHLSPSEVLQDTGYWKVRTSHETNGPAYLLRFPNILKQSNYLACNCSLFSLSFIVIRFLTKTAFFESDAVASVCVSVYWVAMLKLQDDLLI